MYFIVLQGSKPLHHTTHTIKSVSQCFDLSLEKQLQRFEKLLSIRMININFLIIKEN